MAWAVEGKWFDKSASEAAEARTEDGSPWRPRVRNRKLDVNYGLTFAPQ